MRISDIYKNVGDLQTFWKTAKKHGHDKRYEYAVNMIAHFIFGDKDRGNLYYQLLEGATTGNSTCIEGGSYPLSCLMLDHEYNWRYNLADINVSIANMPLNNGELVKDWY